MMYEQIRYREISVFISHSWAYTHHYAKLEEWIFQKNWKVDDLHLKFTNQSVPKSDPIHYAANDRELELAIQDKIIISDIIVIPTGMYASYSKWIGKEIKISERLSKPILAVDPWDQQRGSGIVRSHANCCVKWQSKSVMEAIWRLCNG